MTAGRRRRGVARARVPYIVRAIVEGNHSLPWRISCMILKDSLSGNGRPAFSARCHHLFYKPLWHPLRLTRRHLAPSCLTLFAVVIRINGKICLHLSEVHHHRGIKFLLLAFQFKFGVAGCFRCVPFPSLPKLLWRGPRRDAQRILFSLLDLVFQQPDLEVPFPLLNQMSVKLG